MLFLYIATIFLFYLFAVLQNSFFVHFSLFGAVLNIVFIFFFLLVFFQKKASYYKIIFYSIFAGLFLDFFSYTYFGVSIILLLFVGLIGKKIQTSLQEKNNDKFPTAYFVLLFLFSFTVYDFLLRIFLSSFNFLAVLQSVNIGFILEVVYNFFVAFVVFYIYKKFFVKKLKYEKI
jgi:rod shape-determining protein MreD